MKWKIDDKEKTRWYAIYLLLSKWNILKDFYKCEKTLEQASIFFS